MNSSFLLHWIAPLAGSYLLFYIFSNRRNAERSFLLFLAAAFRAWVKRYVR